MSMEHQSPDLRARVSIRKAKMSNALLKIAKVAKMPEFRSAAEGLSLLTIEQICEQLKPISSWGRDLLHFNHTTFDFSEEGMEKATQLIVDMFPYLVDVYRGVSALIVYAGLDAPPRDPKAPLVDEQMAKKVRNYICENLMGMPFFIENIPESLVPLECKGDPVDIPETQPDEVNQTTD